MDIDKSIINKISEIANCFDHIEKVILFGSRARGDNGERSDIDLAIYAQGDISEFIYAIETQVETLLKFDISSISETTDLIFKEQIEREGVILYEKP